MPRASGVISAITATVLQRPELWCDSRPAVGISTPGETPPEDEDLDGGDLAEAGLRHRIEEGLARGRLVVPAERDLAHEVRVRKLEALVPAQRAGEPVDAALTADAADLDRLGDGRHVTTVASRRHLGAARSPPARAARSGAARARAREQTRRTTRRDGSAVRRARRERPPTGSAGSRRAA